MNNENNILYIKAEGGRSVLGLLKIGEKNLFYHDYMGNVKELKPLCVLDFYVHESVQRGGIGKVNLLFLSAKYKQYYRCYLRKCLKKKK